MTRPTPSTLIRAAAVITFLYFLGHTSGVPWTPAEGPDAAAVIASMQAVRFDAEGATRSYWDFYLGFGLIISAFLLAQSVLLWQLGSRDMRGRASVLPLLATFIALFALNALLGFRYFFAVPAVMALAIAACLIAAAAFAAESAGASREV